MRKHATMLWIVLTIVFSIAVFLVAEVVIPYLGDLRDKNAKASGEKVGEGLITGIETKIQSQIDSVLVNL